MDNVTTIRMARDNNFFMGKGLKFRNEYKALVNCKWVISLRQLHCFCYRCNYILLFAFLSVSLQANGQSESSLLELRKSIPEGKHDSIYYELFKLNFISDFQKANHYSRLAYQLSEAYQHYLLQIDVCYDQANLYDNNNQPDSSIIYFHKAIQLSSMHKLNDWLIYLYNSLGLHHQKLDVYDSALHYFILSYNLSSENQSYGSQAVACHNIGLVDSYLENYDDAILYFKKAIEIKTQNHITKGLDLNYLNLARVYSEQNNYNDAIEQLKKVKLICKDGCEDNTLAGLNYSLGYANFKKGNNEKSHAFFSKALAFARKGGNRQWLSNTLFQLSYFSIESKDYEEALRFLQESQKLATETTHRRLLSNIYQQFSIVYDKVGNSDQARHYEKLHMQLKDKIFNRAVANNIKNIQLNEQRKQANIIIQEKETALWESYVIAALIGLNFVLMCIVVYLVFKALIISRQQRAELEKDILQMMVNRMLGK